MKKITVILLLITSNVAGQDQGKFEKNSNSFYKKIISESKIYEEGEKEEKLVKKDMN